MKDESKSDCTAFNYEKTFLVCHRCSLNAFTDIGKKRECGGEGGLGEGQSGRKIFPV